MMWRREWIPTKHNFLLHTSTTTRPPCLSCPMPKRPRSPTYPFWTSRTFGPLALMFAMGALASLPLWYAKRVLSPKTNSDRRRYASLWVRVPYILLCVVAVAVVWMWMSLGWTHLHVCQSSDPSGYGVTSFAALIPMAIMLFVMAPLALAYGVARLTHGDKTRPPPASPARHPIYTDTSPTGPARSLAR